MYRGKLYLLINKTSIIGFVLEWNSTAESAISLPYLHDDIYIYKIWKLGLHQ